MPILPVGRQCLVFEMIVWVTEYGLSVRSSELVYKSAFHLLLLHPAKHSHEEQVTHTILKST